MLRNLGGRHYHYFRGNSLPDIRKIIIESLGNPNWVILCPYNS